ncbi:MAG: hypothetical protein WCO00_14855 [Rhodospirillaceae bacterium]
MTALPTAKSVTFTVRSDALVASGGSTLFSLGGESLVRVRNAYQRDGRLAAAAALRQQNGALTMTDALWTIDRALGLRKPPAIF